MIKAVNISKSYRQVGGSLEVLKDVSLQIDSADALAIVGPSGAGKSTLLHILGGLDSPSQGQVYFQGEDLYRLNDARRAQVRNTHIGFVFQFYHLLPELTAFENVMLPARVQKNLKKNYDPKEKALKLLKDVGLEKRVTHRPSELSGGEQQRVAIARALMNEPSVILCDEPTGNLDSQSGQAIIELLLALNVEKKRSLVMVTHDEDMAGKFGRIIHIKDGEIIQTEHTVKS